MNDDQLEADTHQCCLGGGGQTLVLETAEAQNGCRRATICLRVSQGPTNERSLRSRERRKQEHPNETSAVQIPT